MAFAVAVDIGGTFTDLVAYDHENHRVAYAKSPTTYGNFVEGILDCFNKVKLAPEAASFVNHGTTLVINSLIQRKGAKAALVTTTGFRDVLEIARGNRPDPFDLHYRRDDPLIPRPLRFEVPERIGSQGEIVTPLDTAALTALAEKIKSLGIEAVAIFFMNSYANPVHEEQAAAALRALLPGVYITCSTELTREWYEYERTSTVAANAYVGPQVTTYIRRLEGDLAGKGFSGTLYMMGSNGGLLSVERTCRQPVGLVESGPIGGCIGAGAYAEALGLEERHRLRHGRHHRQMRAGRGRPLLGRLDLLRRRLREGISDQVVGDQHRRGRLRRRLDRLARSAEPPVGRPAKRGLDARPRLLRQRRHRADGDRRQSRAGAAQSRPLPRRRAEARCRGGAQGGAEDRRAARLFRRRRSDAHGRRHHLARHRHHGGRDQDRFPSSMAAIRANSCCSATAAAGRCMRRALARELSIPTVIIPPEPGNFSAVGMLLADARLDVSKTFTGGSTTRPWRR